ncbi:hypothetical protein VKT23_006422 [Stygiomarasmius scandens]
MQLSSTSRQLPVDDSQSETLTLVDSRDDRSNTPSKQSPSKGSGQSSQYQHRLPIVAEMLDPEDMAWGSPPSSSWGWSLFSRPRGNNSGSSSKDANRRAKLGAQGNSRRS